MYYLFHDPEFINKKTIQSINDHSNQLGKIGF